ncbi:metalloregulator ArsR/SmtB family transcription factor [Homoserinimonas sp. OAct 916]|uniref:helix-turn-helix transcriptional regulator n=1 Tax=Homoserinimonas sp. OAct 916 TaxID=2211450 RepID=UPI00130047DE|nr:helix-turn-helix domain-containing protein [Homoserinimonas sp. OAct 916]
MASGGRPLYRTLASLSRVNLLRALQSGDRMTVAELAAATGLHHNTAREHLDRLISAGFVSREAEVRTSKGRPRQLYSIGQARTDPRLLKNIDEALRRSDQIRRLLRVDDVITPPTSVPGSKTEIKHDNPRTDQLDLLDDHMDRCGIDATVKQEAESARVQMQMQNCPYSTLAKAHPQVCQTHFKLVQDVLQRVDGPLEAESISPFADENHCTLDLREAPGHN